MLITFCTDYLTQITYLATELNSLIFLPICTGDLLEVKEEASSQRPVTSIALWLQKQRETICLSNILPGSMQGL